MDPKKLPYFTAPVAKANIRQVVSSTGTLQAVTTVLVGSQVSGTIAKLNADYNSKVTKEQVVAPTRSGAIRRACRRNPRQCAGRPSQPGEIESCP